MARQENGHVIILSGAVTGTDMLLVHHKRVMISRVFFT